MLHPQTVFESVHCKLTLYAVSRTADPFAQMKAEKETAQTTEKDLGPLPGEAKALLITLAVVWVLMGGYMLYTAIRKKQKK